MGMPSETCARSVEGERPNKDKSLSRLEGVMSIKDCFCCPERLVAPINLWNPIPYPISLDFNKDPAETADKGTPASPPTSLMPRDGPYLTLDLTNNSSLPSPVSAPDTTLPPLQWDWSIEHEDRKRERKADAALHGATPFEVDRKLLKDVVREKMGREVGRIKFLSAGTFHKAYLVTLVDRYELVARVARRFMPRLKTESEVATMHYLREKTKIPVPTVYHYDSNPYNRLGGEFILMSKAPGIPLAQVFHTLAYNDLVKLLKNVAAIVISLFSHRFSEIGSLYFGPNPRNVSSGAPTPKAAQMHYSAFPFSPTLAMSTSSNALKTPKPTHKTITSAAHDYHVGPIISWPFFGSNRGDLTHPTELNRGPWSITESYLASCADREITGVIRENEGRSAPHKLHLDPAEIISSRHHRLKAIPGDESDESDEWDLEESEEEDDGPGDRMYRDYRRMQRSTFLVAHLSRREDAVRKEMGRWMRMMEHLSGKLETHNGPEEFGLDAHDLSLENVFVDSDDHTKITCIIDWESTTTRPLWQCAHVPAFLQSSPFVTKLFLEAVAQLPSDPSVVHLHNGKDKSLEALCREWLYYESAGTRLRYAHRCAEWDGWEEGLVDSILGPEEHEDEWYKSITEHAEAFKGMTSPPHPAETSQRGKAPLLLRGTAPKLPFAEERRKEQMLNITGDICGGRGGELGRRLEAWLTVNGNEEEARKGRWGDHLEEPLSAT